MHPRIQELLQKQEELERQIPPIIDQIPGDQKLLILDNQLRAVVRELHRLHGNPPIVCASWLYSMKKEQ